MADGIKISELLLTNSYNNSDFIPIVQGNETRKIRAECLLIDNITCNVFSNFPDDLTGTGRILIGRNLTYPPASASNSNILGGDYHEIEDCYNNIVGGISGLISNTSCSNVIGGSGNKITDSNNSSIFGGSNTLMTQSSSSAIIGGKYNCLYEASNSFIIGSNISECNDNNLYINNLSAYCNINVGGIILSGGNNITRTISFGDVAQVSNYYCGKICVISLDVDKCIIVNPSSNFSNNKPVSLLGGMQNEILSSFSFIGGGLKNKVKKQYSSAVTGNDNILNREYNFVGTGQEGRLYGQYNVIGSGKNNNVRGNYSSILNGCRNTTNGSFNNILGGERNTSCESYSNVIGGKCNTAGCNFTTVIGGSGNFVVAPYSFGAGVDNRVDNYFSQIYGGCKNQTGAIYSSIGGGKCNTIFPTATFSTIANGSNNEIREQNSFIGAGKENIILEQNSSVVSGVCNNTCGDNSVILNGRNNTTDKKNSSILGGSYNTTKKENSTIVNSLSSCSNGDNSVIIGGENNTSLANDTIILGSKNEVSSRGSSILGGNNNIVEGTVSTIINGFNSYLSRNANNSFIAGNSLSGYSPNTFYLNQLSAAQGIIVDGQITLNGESISSFTGAFDEITDEQGNLIENDTLQSVTQRGNTTNCNIVVGTLSQTGNYLQIGIDNNQTFINEGDPYLQLGFENNTLCSYFNGNGILGGNNNILDNENSFIIGSNITSDKDNTLFVENISVSANGSFNSITTNTLQVLSTINTTTERFEIVSENSLSGKNIIGDDQITTFGNIDIVNNISNFSSSNYSKELYTGVNPIETFSLSGSRGDLKGAKFSFIIFNTDETKITSFELTAIRTNNAVKALVYNIFNSNSTLVNDISAVETNNKLNLLIDVNAQSTALIKGESFNSE